MTRSAPELPIALHTTGEVRPRHGRAIRPGWTTDGLDERIAHLHEEYRWVLAEGGTTRSEGDTR